MLFSRSTRGASSPAIRRRPLPRHSAARGGGLLSAALHPSGAQIVVGLAAGMRVLHVLEFERRLLLRAALPLPGAVIVRFRHVADDEMVAANN